MRWWSRSALVVALAVAVPLGGYAVPPGGNVVAAASPEVVPVTPDRVIDTRQTSRLPAGGHVEIAVAGWHEIPADASAVFLNVTAVDPDEAGYLSAWPCGPRAGTSTVNYTAGRTVANAALVGTSPSGTVCIYSRASADVVVDVAGYVPAGGTVRPAGPGRVIDTRQTRRVAAGGIVEIPATGVHGVPADASAVFLNVTVVEPTGAGYLTLWPCDAPRPLASNVNYLPGQVVANAVLAKTSSTGTVCAYSLADTDVVVDVTGYVPAGGSVAAVEPHRVTDTRRSGRLAPGGVVEVNVAAAPGVPTDAAAVFLNVTAVDPDDAGYLTVWPCGPRPLASNVNYVAGQTVPNAVFAKTSGSGTVCIYSRAAADVVVDVAAYVPGAPTSGLRAVLDSLTVADPDPARPRYVRDDWDGEGWDDVDGDCVNTRHELLEARSQVPATFSGCNVVSGRWVDPYDGSVYTLASQVQIDHLVALAEAHRSGGWRWDTATKHRFANDVTNDHLVVAGASTNQSKADSTPDRWMPPDPAAHCWYAISWVEVKFRYRLTVTAAERSALATALDGCPEGAAYRDLTPAPVTFVTPSTPTTTVPPTTTTPPTSPQAGALVLVSCNAITDTVVIRNTGASTVNLSGWILHDHGNNHRVDLGTLRGSLGAGQQLGIVSGSGTVGAGQVRWKTQPVWNNDGDTAYLVSPSSVISSRPCST